MTESTLLKKYNFHFYLFKQQKLSIQRKLYPNLEELLIIILNSTMKKMNFYKEYRIEL
jgi:hypothetical protein